MIGRWIVGIVAVLVAVGLGGCGTLGPTASLPPEPSADRAASLSVAELQTGRDLYINKCARCHKFYDPAKYSDAEWHSWMAKMSRKARLQPEQTEVLSKYLDLYRPHHDS